MRCKNCGWDNPGGNVICEKCNASMNDAPGNEGMSPCGYVTDDCNPRSTIAGFEPDDMNLRATIKGCASCGYPVKPDDTVCPVCSNPFTGHKKEPEVEKKAPAGGTIIQGANYEEEKTDAERKKLTGFLVSYSHSPNGQSFPLYEGKNTIGRDASSHVVIQGDSSVSEKHFSILYRAVDRKFKFRDEQSSNGTFVNDKLTDEGELKNFDLIRIGSTLLLFMEIPLSSFD